MKDDEFQPKLGRQRAQDGKSSRNYLHRVMHATALAGGPAQIKSRSSNRTFYGGRVGRGAGVGRVLFDRGPHAGFRGRRVVVKSRIVRLTGKNLRGVQAHLRYLQRDGVTREGLSGQLYSAELDQADGKGFIGRGEGDRHQFRFIVAPEDSAEYEDLKPLTRRLMAQVEKDLGTELDWVAVDHHNTGHPHTHILLRGKDDRGKDLVIAREYISKGLRERAAEIVSLDLGPRSERIIQNGLRQEVEQERLTSLDRRLIAGAKEGIVLSGQHDDSVRQALHAGRLQKLSKLGLAKEVAPSAWRLAPDLEPVLRRMGERGDIIKTMHREMARAGVVRSATDFVIEEAAPGAKSLLIGRVLGRGLSAELGDRHYLIVDGIDGRVHYAEIGKGEGTALLPEGCIVSVIARTAEIRSVDRTIIGVAERYEGYYSVDLHLKHDHTATAAFAEAHIRRLEAMRRAGMGAERQSDGRWKIAPDHLEQTLKYERQQNRTAPVRVEILSPLPIERLISAEGATWLDRELVAKTPAMLRDTGFGQEVRAARAQRLQWLIEQELAEQQPGGIVFRAGFLAHLQQREVERTGAQLGAELGMPFAGAEEGHRIEGTYRKHIDLVSGRFAMVENGRQFTLVPWRPVLERSLGKSVSGVARGDTISWSSGRQRGATIS